MSSNQAINVLHILYKVDHLLPLFNLYADAVLCDGGTVTTVFLCGPQDDAVIQATHASKVVFCGFTANDLRKHKGKVSATLRNIWSEGSYDLAICQRHKPSFAFSMARIGLKQAPMLSVVHALGQYQRRNRRLHAQILYGYSRNKTRVIAVSDAVYNDINTSFSGKPPCELTTIPNCIDSRAIQAEQLTKSNARQRLGLTDSDLVIGNVARLVTDKGQRYLLSAFAAVLPECPQLKLVLIGSGDLANTLQQQAQQLGITQQVIFAGNQPHAARLMPAFDVFVLASVREPFGLVLLEAMAAKLPIIASSVNSIPDILGNHASLVEPGNIDQLAQALTEFIQMDPKLKQQAGEAAFAQLYSKYSTEQFHQQVQVIITELLQAA